MNIVTVIPIARGIGKETLSYFSAQTFAPGSFIKVPLRNRLVGGLVITTENAEKKKAELRQSSFAMRKIMSGKSKTIFSPVFIEAATEMASYSAGSTGSVLANITSKTILEQADKLEKIDLTLAIPNERRTTHEPYTLQADEEDRFAHYKSLIREQFAHTKSVFFVLPTIQDTKKIFEQLPKGIEQYTFVLNSSLSKKEIVETWNKIILEPHPVLIISTGSFLGIPRSDIGAIIIERESSSSFKTQSRPYIDIRTFCECFARRLNAKLIFGDLLLRTETLWRTKNGDMGELSPLKFRSTSTAETVLIDMKKYKTLDEPEFRIVSDELVELVKKSQESNENMFIFAARRGLAPMTVCGDCGTTVLCSRCNAPIILHRASQGNFFLCHRCGERRSAEERCRNCDSWKLTTLGIGIELIEESLKSMFPDTKIFRMDKDTVTTHKQASRLAGDFFNSPGSILLGTEMALGYVERPVENAAVAAIDSLFSIPDFRINEKIMNILLRIRSFTQKTYIIQTRSRDQALFDYATKGNLMDFYRDEIDERKRLDYPPFSVLIKLTVRGTPASAAKDMALVEKALADHNPLVFPAFIEKVNRKTVLHALLRLKPEEWPDQTLYNKLIALPPNISINVDPESLL
jgi:primosomal protein N' (replication factor Y)